MSVRLGQVLLVETPILHKIPFSLSMRGSPLIDSEQDPPTQSFIYLQFIEIQWAYNIV